MTTSTLLATADAPTEGLRVERCPTCGARYNVTRLAPGSRFACRRCGGSVTVAPPLGATTTATERARPSLAVAGVLLLLGAALRSLPGVYAGEGGTPWTAVVESLSLADAVALALAAVTGGVAIASAARGMSSSRGGRATLAALAVAALVLFLRAHGPETPVLSAAAPDPAGALGFALLAAGALVLASTRAESRGAARWLVVAGVALVVAGAASRFASSRTTVAPAASPLASSSTFEIPAYLARGRSGAASGSLLSARADAVSDYAVSVWRGEAPRSSDAPWDDVLPDGLTLVAAVVALLCVLVPGRGSGPLSRGVGRFAFALLLAAAVAPHAASLWSVREGWLATGGATLLAKEVTHAVFDGGLGLWLLGASVVAALADPRGTTPRGRAASGIAHALATAAAVGSVLLLSNPTNGVLARAWPWDAVGAGLSSSTSVSVSLVGVLAVASFLALVVPWLRARGGLVAAAAAIAACASDLAVPSSGAPRFAVPALLAVAAGATLSRRGATWDGRGRATATAAAGAIALLLAFPSGASGAAGAPDERPAGTFPCALTSLAKVVDDVARGAARIEDFVADPALTAAAVGGVGAVLALLAALAGPRRPFGLSLATLAIALALHGPAIAIANALGGLPASSAAVVRALPAAGAALLLFPAAAVVAAIGVAMDAVGGRPRLPAPGAASGG